MTNAPFIPNGESSSRVRLYTEERGDRETRLVLRRGHLRDAMRCIARAKQNHRVEQRGQLELIAAPMRKVEPPSILRSEGAREVVNAREPFLVGVDVHGELV